MEFIEDLPEEPVSSDSYFVYGFDMGLLPEGVEVTGLVLCLRVQGAHFPYPFLVAKESENVAAWEVRGMLDAALRMYEPGYEIEVEG